MLAIKVPKCAFSEKLRLDILGTLWITSRAHMVLQDSLISQTTDQTNNKQGQKESF